MKMPSKEMPRPGGSRSIAGARFRRQCTHLYGIQRPLYSASAAVLGGPIGTLAQLGHWHCGASGGPPAVLAGVPNGPKAAAAAGPGLFFMRAPFKIQYPAPYPMSRYRHTTCRRYATSNDPPERT
jgi:hypothetical protein